MPSPEARKQHSSPESAESARILSGVLFKKFLKPDGSFEYKSSDSSRKMIVLEQGALDIPEEGISYDVEIVKDTDLTNPRLGKFVVRIVGEEGAPIAERKRKRAKEIPSPIEIDEESGTVAILETELPLNPQRGELVPRPERFRLFTLDTRTLETIEKIATAVELREPCLLEGETSTSKTSSIEYLAMLTGNEVVRLNLNGQTDTSELVGKFVPNDGELQIQFEEFFRHPELLGEESRAIIQRAEKEGRGLTMFETQKLAEREGLKIADWRWQDGLDVRAKKEGKWLILDEINLAEPQILERLNSQLEKNPSMTLSENGGVMLRKFTEEEYERYREGKLGSIEPLHENFRIFATMNPAEYSARNPMSPAYKDRWTSYKYVESPTEQEYVAMLEFGVYGTQPEIISGGVKYRGEEAETLFPQCASIENFKGFLTKLARFHTAVEDLSRRREIGKNRKERYIFTRRTLIEFLDFLEHKTIIDRKNGKRLSVTEIPEMVISRALQYYYLDKMAHQDDLKKMKDQLDAVGISEEKWTHKFKK